MQTHCGSPRRNTTTHCCGALAPCPVVSTNSVSCGPAGGGIYYSGPAYQSRTNGYLR